MFMIWGIDGLGFFVGGLVSFVGILFCLNMLIDGCLLIYFEIVFGFCLFWDM